MSTAGILPDGKLSYGLLLWHVLQAIADRKCFGISVLHLHDPMSGLEGSIIFRNAKHICAAKMCDRKRRATGYEALRILCSVAVANYEYDSKPGQNPDQELVLRLDLKEIIELCPTLPETLNVLQNQDTLLDQIFNPSTTVTNAAQLIPNVPEGFLTEDLIAAPGTGHESAFGSQPSEEEESDWNYESDESIYNTLAPDEMRGSQAGSGRAHAVKEPGVAARLWRQCREHPLAVVAAFVTVIGTVGFGLFTASRLERGATGSNSPGAVQEQPAIGRAAKNAHNAKFPAAATQRAHTALANQPHKKPASHKQPDPIR